MTVSEPSIDISGLHVRYGGVVALDGVDLTVHAGRVCALIGMNGSGKSTLFKAVMGLVAPARGTVRITGTAGYVPQQEAVDWTFPVRVSDVVLMGRYASMGRLRRSGPADQRAVSAALEMTGLTGLADRHIGALSGGQRRRVFLARLLAQRADVLLLDEPFAGIDQASEAVLTQALRARADDGAVVVIATHDLAAIPGFADEAVLLQRRVLAHGSTAEVLRPETLALAFTAEESR